MTAFDDTRRMIKQRDKALRDAYHGRNGLSMTDQQRAAYKAMLERAAFAKKMARSH